MAGDTKMAPDDDINAAVYLFMCLTLGAFYLVQNIVRKRKLAAKLAARSKTEIAQDALSDWRRRHKELEAKAGIGEKERAISPDPLFLDPAEDPAEEIRRNMIENHHFGLHWRQSERKLCFSVSDIGLRKQLIESHIELGRLSQEETTAQIEEAKSKVKKAEEVITLAQSKLAEATSDLQQLEYILNLPSDKMQTFSPEEAATGEPDDDWFIEQAWRAYPESLGKVR
jgi:hypothetical protein